MPGISSLDTIGSHLQSAWNITIMAAVKTRRWVIQTKDRMIAAPHEMMNYSKNALVDSKNYLANKFKQIRIADVKDLGMATVATYLTAVFGVAFFGHATIPIITMLGAAYFFIAFYRIHNRIRRVYNEQIWHHLDRIRRHAHDLSPKNRQNQILLNYHVKILLVKKEKDFSHVKEDLEKINNEAKSLLEAIHPVHNPRFEQIKTRVCKHIPYLREMTPDAEKQKFTTCLETVEKAHSDQEENSELQKNMEEIEKIKVEDAADKDRFNAGVKYLKEDINAIMDEINNPRYKTAKMHFNAAIESLQTKLVEDIEIEKLTPTDRAGTTQDEDEELRRVGVLP